MAVSPIIDRIFARIDALSGELAALTSALIRFPTINPPGHSYGPALEYIARWLAPHGFSSRLIRAEGTPGDSDQFPRLNLISRIEGKRPGRCVHFNGHIDVVEVGKGWTVDPFEGLIRDGRVYGRGACDMKGGIASAMMAITAIADLVPDFAGTLELSATADEESGGFGGVGYLAREGWFSRDRVDHVIIPEPLGVGRVCLGHRGVWWGKVTMKGHIGHGSMPFLGANAIRGMGEFLALLETELVPELETRVTRMPCVPDGARRATLNINSIHGGQDETDGLPSPVVADSARVILDRRYLAEEDIEAVRAEITALARFAAARHGLEVDVDELMTFAPVMTDPGSAVVTALDGWIEAVTGRRSEHIASPGTYDQKHIARFGSVFDCVAYGPGILDLAHQPDEWIGIDDMVTSAKIMAAAALSLTGSLQQA